MSIETTEVRPIWLKKHEECDEMFTPSSPIYLSSNLGKVRINVCESCGYEDVECLHIYNRIDSTKVEISCMLCGG